MHLLFLSEFTRTTKTHVPRFGTLRMKPCPSANGRKRTKERTASSRIIVGTLLSVDDGSSGLVAQLANGENHLCNIAYATLARGKAKNKQETKARGNTPRQKTKHTENAGGKTTQRTKPREQIRQEKETETRPKRKDKHYINQTHRLKHN